MDRCWELHVFLGSNPTFAKGTIPDVFGKMAPAAFSHVVGGRVEILRRRLVLKGCFMKTFEALAPRSGTLAPHLDLNFFERLYGLASQGRYK